MFRFEPTVADNPQSVVAVMRPIPPTKQTMKLTKCANDGAVKQGANDSRSEYSACGGMSWGMGWVLGCDGVVW